LHELDRHTVRPAHIDETHTVSLATFDGLRRSYRQTAGLHYTRERVVQVIDIDRTGHPVADHATIVVKKLLSIDAQSFSIKLTRDALVKPATPLGRGLLGTAYDADGKWWR
jgi:hypothetical protein